MLLKGQLLTYNENTRREKEEIWETIMTEDFLQINARHQTTVAESAENTKQDFYDKNKNLKKTATSKHVIFKH